MTLVPILTVEDTFWIVRPGVQMLVLHPAFPVPPGWNARGWNQRTEKVIVLRPDQSELEATAQISMTHLNIRDPQVPVEDRWRLTVWLTDCTAEEVPAGSKILVSPEVRDSILPANVADHALQEVSAILRRSSDSG